VLAALYPCVTAVAVLSTGNHFVLDMLGGALTLVLAATCVRLGGALGRRMGGAAGLRQASERGLRALCGACHKVVTKSPTR
jgi:hypothetical protein